ncbi:unnamed protein product [Musa acuminata var. zebrina]
MLLVDRRPCVSRSTSDMEAITGTRRSREYHSLEIAGDAETKGGRRAWMRWAAPAACVLCVPLLLLLVGDHRRPSFDWFQGATHPKGSTSVSSSVVGEASKDKLLGGLLSAEFEDCSCFSRYRSAAYRKASPHLPSPYLVERLRRYEALHRKCGPNTELYKKSIERLKSKQSSAIMECNYIVWIPHYGLGNRVVSLVSSFLYALLNDRVLLVHVPHELTDLFCEPFPGTSWVLPSDFPVHNFQNFDKDTPQSFGNMLRDKVISIDMRSSANATLPAYVYLHLPWYYNEWDKLFFCQDAQQMLRKVPWLLLKSDHYFVPSLFLVEEYDDELRRLFPERTTVFHHLVRYLLHPSNTVWGYVTRYYHAYLAKADKRVGIQIRNLKNEPVPFETLLGQIVTCSSKEGILPSIDLRHTARPAEDDAKVTAVFTTSLDSGYSDRIRDMYYEHATTTGEIVGVYQASHEVEQQTEHQNHNIKALSEITLLSFSDVLITTACSTFGYVAQGLGGLEPLILTKPWKSKLPCRWAESPEPCFLIPPPSDVCRDHGGINKKMAQHVRQCEDENGGVKLFD